MRSGSRGDLDDDVLYEGYVKELADLIALEIGVQFEIRPVLDGKYGSRDGSRKGKHKKLYSAHWIQRLASVRKVEVAIDKRGHFICSDRGPRSIGDEVAIGSAAAISNVYCTLCLH